MNDHNHYGGLPGEGCQAGPAQHALGGFEERLLAELAMEVASRAAAPRPQRWRERAVACAAGVPRWARPAVLGTAAMTAAGAAAIALIAAPVMAPGAAGSHGHAASGPAVTATAVLRNAALAALQAPAAPPEPGQFVYSKILTEGPATQQEWISADGTRTGLGEFSGGGVPGTLPLRACVHGFVDPVIVATATAHYSAPQVAGFDDPLIVYSTAGPGSLRNMAGRKIHCTPGEFAGYQPGIPTAQAALRSYLSRMHQTRLALGLAIGVNHHLAGISSSVWSDPTLIRELMTDVYLSPQQRAAMYRLLEHAPGLTVLPRVTDLQGKTGVGIGVPWKPGTLSILIFDPKTYTLLGGATRWTSGQLEGQWLLAQAAIVNKAGQAP